MSATATDPSLMLMELAAECATDPLAFAHGFWPDRTLRTWQADVLSYVRDRLTNPETRHKVVRIAVASGNGIGKSALIGMLLTWGMATCAGCRAKVTAGKAEQLETKTVPEVSAWFKHSLAAEWFDVRAKSIRSTQTATPENWRVDFETWTEEKPDTFQGLHNLGKRILMVFDEGSGIADVIYDAAETSLTDENTELIFIVFGNPIRNTGRFRELFGSHQYLWHTMQIDSRTVEGVNREQADEWVRLYGEDSDFVRVKVRGEFPRAGSSQFIAGDIVAACRKYKAESYQHLPKVLSVDVARQGDDQSVLLTRQGRKVTVCEKLRGKDTVFVAERAIHWMQQEGASAIVVDGDGIGAGVVDQIKARGFSVFEFHGGAQPNDPAAYFNRRAEVWGLMRNALHEGMEIPDDPEMASDLCGPEYGFSSKGQIQLERKEDMKKRGLSSPDNADALAMTFSVRLAPPAPKSNNPPPRVGVWS